MKLSARLCACILGAVSPATPAALNAQEPAGFRDALQLLDVWVATTTAQRGQPGLSIGVVLGDSLVWAKGYGYADVANKVAATPRTLYRVASITKTFTAVAILQLRDAGKLRLDDPLRQHVSASRIRARDADLPDVTLRELLTHSSGLQREVPGTFWSGPRQPGPDSLRAELEQVYLSSTQWKYSNLGFSLLGEVVAGASGEPWDRYVQRRILGPLRMGATRPIARRDEPGLAIGYARPVPGGAHVRAPDIIELGAINAAGGLASSVEDLGRYVAFHLNETTARNAPVLSGASLRDMHRPHWLLDDWQNAWGLGMRVRRVDGLVRIGHGGSLPGYRSAIEFIPSLGLGVIALTNADDGAPANYTDYTLQLLAPIVAKAKATALAGVQDPEQYVGRYQDFDGSATELIVVLAGQLSRVAPDAANPYLARTILEPTREPHTFIMRPTTAFSSSEFGETIVFDVGERGQVSGYHTANYRTRRVGGVQ